MEEAGTEEKEAEMKSKIEIHETIHLMRASQGVQKVDDEVVFDGKSYVEYRRYLSRRISDLRQKLDLKMRRKGHKEFLKALEFGPVNSERCLLEALLAERAWATAMEIKQNSERTMHRMVVAQDDDDDEEGKENEDTYPRRYRLRLRKAAQHAQCLREAVEKECTTMRPAPKILSEVRAMAMYYQGIAFELQSPEEAADELRGATKQYSELAAVGSAQQRDIFALRLAEARTALQRCEYALRLRGHVVKTEDTHDETPESISIDREESDLMVNWCGRSVAIIGDALQEKVRACPSLLADDMQILADTQNPFQFTQIHKEENKEEDMTKSLRQLDEVVRAVVNEEKSLASFKGGGERVQAVQQDLNYLKARTQYDRLCLIAKRLEDAVTKSENEYHFALASRGANVVQSTLFSPYSFMNRDASAQTKSKSWAHYDQKESLTQAIHPQSGADELIRLLDALSRVYADVAALEGFTDGPDDSAAERLEAIKAALRAQRSFFLAHMNNADTKIRLFGHTTYLCQRARLEAEAAGVDLEKMDALANEAQANLFRAVLFSSMAESAVVKSQPKVEDDEDDDIDNETKVAPEKNSTYPEAIEIPVADRRFSHYHHFDQQQHRPSLYHLPPKPKPIPPRPLLFNIAHNNLTFPVDKLDKLAGLSAPDQDDSKSAASRGGLFGWFRGSRQAAPS